MLVPLRRKGCSESCNECAFLLSLWNYYELFTMKRLLSIMSIILFASISFIVEAKSTMELLINKDWHELDLISMKAQEFYVRFTGTQRMIVSADSAGNTIAKAQRYYLSNKYTETFDSTKVGKRKKGNYIIIQGDRNSVDRNVICLELKELGDNVMRFVDRNEKSNQERYYYSDLQFMGKKGDVITTLDLLMNKIWFQVDPITGERLNVEHQYGKNGKFVRCIMPENRRTQYPQWFRREFYLSDTIVTKFNRKKVGSRLNGRYIVVNELDSDGSWQAATYDIATLSENRLELECVYPKGYATQVFVSNIYSQNAEHAKRKPQQSELMKDGWYRLDTTTFKRSRYIERYNKTHVTRIVPIYSGGDTVELKKIYEYYMSNQPEAEFDWSKKGKTSEGDYIVVNEQDLTGKWQAVNYRVELLSGGNMITVKEVPGDTIIQTFERDLNEEDKLKLAYQQKQQAEADSAKEKTMMDMLVGKQWRCIVAGQKIISGSVNADYYTETKLIAPFFYKTDGGWITEIRNWDYKLSDKLDFDFSYKEQAKKRKNGRFFNYCGYYDMRVGGAKRSYNFEILYLSEKVMVNRSYNNLGFPTYIYIEISE